MTITVALVDGGIPATADWPVIARAVFGAGAPSPAGQAHAQALAMLIAQQAPQAGLLDARVFGHDGPASASAVAEGVDWCVAHGARVINLSLGLREDRPSLQTACARALAAGVVLVASTPARGGAVYPAAYAGVVAVCGDARCEDRSHSLLEAPRLLGAAPFAPGRRPGGASFAAARISALIAARLASEPSLARDDLMHWLSDSACFHGREHRLETCT